MRVVQPEWSCLFIFVQKEWFYLLLEFVSPEKLDNW
jgi:hypothetical protein